MWRWNADDDLANCRWDFPDPPALTGLQRLLAKPSVFIGPYDTNMDGVTPDLWARAVSNSLSAIASRFNVGGRFA